MRDWDPNPGDIAVIGMAGRFPGAADIDQLWRNLCDGKEAMQALSEEQLQAAGVPQERIADPAYVRASYPLADADRFDAAFFGYAPREARSIDPQQRVLLECAWQAMDDAGYGAGTSSVTGVYAGCSLNTYMLNSGMADLFATEPVLALMSSDKDFLATRIGYKLNLQGPCVTVQSACSTSLVALHAACQALLAQECDMALAGGVCVKVPLEAGYMYREGGMLSRDGHCRPFDADASGTIFGSGAGVVVLKRYSQAVEDGDTIRAVIRGTAINNDGARKASYTAPSVEGISEALRQALDFGGVAPRQVGYVECHGTGTALGDPIEVRALRSVFDGGDAAAPWCTLGSVKGNIGHLEAASGIAGFIKAVACLEQRTLPGTMHYRSPNPALELAGSPFRISAASQEWQADGRRHACVLSLGVGGTNAAVVLAEAPPSAPAPASARWHLLPLSATTPLQLETGIAAMQRRLGVLAPQRAADAAWTLGQGRRAWPLRRSWLVDSTSGRSQMVDAPAVPAPKHGTRPVAFLCGAAAPRGMQHSAGWQSCRAAVVAELAAAGAGTALLAAVPTDTVVAQLASARWWSECGLAPAAVLGNGIGALTAARLSGAIDVATLVRLLRACSVDDCALLSHAGEVYAARSGTAPELRSLQAATLEQLNAAVQAQLDRHADLLWLPLGASDSWQQAIATLPALDAAGESEAPALLRQLALLWQSGAAVALDAPYRGEQRQRIPLPVTALRGERHWW